MSKHGQLEENNGKLKQELLVLSAENELLRMTSPPASHSPSKGDCSRGPSLACESAPSLPAEQKIEAAVKDEDNEPQMLSWPATFQLLTEHMSTCKGHVQIGEL